MATQEGHLFLGEPQWEVLAGGGRVRCVQTGHEMPISEQPTYGSTKKCRSALFEAALKKRTPPLNFFEQSPTAKDKIVCKLTGVVLNKKEDAVWKHMLGKRFEQKLVEKEEEKEIAREDVEMAQNSSEKWSSENSVEMGKFSGDGGKTRRKHREKLAEISPDEELEEDANNSEGSDFWIPPADERWDFDTGSADRWSVPLLDDLSTTHPSKINGHNGAASLEDVSELDNCDTEMVDGEEAEQENGSTDDDNEMIRTKRTSSSSRSRSQKKCAKRSKAESSQQHGE